MLASSSGVPVDQKRSCGRKLPDIAQVDKPCDFTIPGKNFRAPPGIGCKHLKFWKT